MTRKYRSRMAALMLVVVLMWVIIPVLHNHHNTIIPKTEKKAQHHDSSTCLICAFAATSFLMSSNEVHLSPYLTLIFVFIAAPVIFISIEKKGQATLRAPPALV